MTTLEKITFKEIATALRNINNDQLDIVLDTDVDIQELCIVKSHIAEAVLHLERLADPNRTYPKFRPGDLLAYPDHPEEDVATVVYVGPTIYSIDYEGYGRELHHLTHKTVEEQFIKANCNE